jgi:mRNA interferase MazF
MAAYCPKRGDIIWISFNSQAGHEQSGHRFALVLSPEPYNGKVGLAILCPVTNQVKGYPFEVKVPPGLKAAGVILSDQVKSMDWKVRGASFVCALPENVVRQVLNKVGTLLDT